MGRKLIDHETIIARLRAVHGDEYGYEKVVYKGNKKPITLVCRVHGDFTALPNNIFYNKTGCKQCRDSWKGPGKRQQRLSGKI